MLGRKEDMWRAAGFRNVSFQVPKPWRYRDMNKNTCRTVYAEMK